MCSIKKGVLKNFANFTGKHMCWILFKVCNFIKKGTPAQVISCKFCEIFKNTYFEEHLKVDKFTNFYKNRECLLCSISIFYDESYWRKWKMMTIWFLSRLTKSVASWQYIFSLLSCLDSPWTDIANKSAKRNLFPQSERNCWVNIMSNQWHNPYNVCA